MYIKEKKESKFEIRKNIMFIHLIELSQTK
jgi:hypothetical protein